MDRKLEERRNRGLELCEGYETRKEPRVKASRDRGRREHRDKRSKRREGPKKEKKEDRLRRIEGWLGKRLRWPLLSLAPKILTAQAFRGARKEWNTYHLFPLYAFPRPVSASSHYSPTSALLTRRTLPTLLLPCVTLLPKITIQAVLVWTNGLRAWNITSQSNPEILYNNIYLWKYSVFNVNIYFIKLR